MSVLIRGMSMPENCSQGDAEVEKESGYGDTICYYCPYIYKGYTDDSRYVRRLDECPLVELPTKHGRLIDEREVKNAFDRAIIAEAKNAKTPARIRATSNEVAWVLYAVQTVVEAEGESEGEDPCSVEIQRLIDGWGEP